MFSVWPATGLSREGRQPARAALLGLAALFSLFLATSRADRAVQPVADRLEAFPRLRASASPVRYLPGPAADPRPVRIENLSLPARMPQLSLPSPARLARVTPPLAHASRATVKIHAPGRHGAGFFISSDGLLLTSYHVVVGAPYLCIQTAGGQTFTVDRVEAFSAVHDLALLRIDGGPFPWVEVQAGKPADGAGHLFGIGHPKAESWMPFSGEAVSRLQLGPVTFLSFSAPLAPGSSGGPLLDATGGFQGMAAYSATFPDGRTCRLGVPSDTIRRFLARPHLPLSLRELADFHAALEILDLTLAIYWLADDCLSALDAATPASREAADMLLVLGVLIESHILHRPAARPLAASLLALTDAMTEGVHAYHHAAGDPAACASARQLSSDAFRRGLESLAAACAISEREESGSYASASLAALRTICDAKRRP